MPTSRPRYQVTETPELAHVLDQAAERWPGEPRSRLLLRLLAAGADHLERSDASTIAAHRAVVAATKGRYSDAFEPGHLAQIREDWPA